MKFLVNYDVKPCSFKFFKPPEYDRFENGGEWGGDRKAKALENLKALESDPKLLEDRPISRIVLPLLKGFINDQLNEEITDNPELRDFFIERLAFNDLVHLKAEVNRVLVKLVTREDFDLEVSSEEEIFGGFIICWLEDFQS